MIQMPDQPSALIMLMAAANTNAGQSADRGDPQAQGSGTGNGQNTMLMQPVQLAGGRRRQ